MLEKRQGLQKYNSRKHKPLTTLAVEVKAADASAGELTRGIYQCIKYCAVLRAMNHVVGELCTVNVILATPKHLLSSHINAARRLRVYWQQVKA
ncbi:hypothetical protein BH10CHL1_BH10CHL1_30730 [soil metagenome]